MSGPMSTSPQSEGHPSRLQRARNSNSVFAVQNDAMPIRLLLNGHLVETDAPPSMTVLDWLREERHLTGTKEGCAEGDCGACTVVLGHPVDDAMALRPVNACIALMGQVDGMALTTVEGLAAGDDLHPVQQALIDTDGTQCGFCTPGIAMSMYALHHGGETPDEAEIHDLLAGNLCRCTGYRPIIESCRSIVGGAPLPAVRPPAARDTLRTAGRTFFAPTSLADLVALRRDHPDAVLLAGGTDLGLRASKGREALPVLISTARVAELRRIEETGDAITIGAAATYAAVLPVAERLLPALAAVLRRLGSRQIRSQGTFGGNLGTASPIGDTLPFLLALDAEIVLAGPAGERTVAAADYFTGYRQTVLRADEVIVAIRLPLPAGDQRLHAYKLSKRFDQDISTLIAVFRTGAEPRAAFGGMAAVPKRARALEQAMAGGRWQEAEAALAADVAPMTDQRGTADYRLRAAVNLVRRLRHEGEGVPLHVEALS